MFLLNIQTFYKQNMYIRAFQYFFYLFLQILNFLKWKRISKNLSQNERKFAEMEKIMKINESTFVHLMY